MMILTARLGAMHVLGYWSITTIVLTLSTRTVWSTNTTTHLFLIYIIIVINNSLKLEFVIINETKQSSFIIIV